MKALLLWLTLSACMITPYLQAAEPVEALTLNCVVPEPYCNSEGSGYFDKVVTEALSRVGLEVTLTMRPEKRGLLLANTGIEDGHYPTLKASLLSYNNLLLVPVSLYKATYVAITKPDSPPIKRWQELQSLSVGYELGWVIFSDRQEHYGSVVLTKEAQQLQQMLNLNRIQVILTELSYFKTIAGSTEVEKYRIHAPPLEVKDIFLSLNQKHTDLIKQVANALDSMHKDGTTEKLCPPCSKTLNSMSDKPGQKH